MVWLNWYLLHSYTTIMQRRKRPHWTRIPSDDEGPSETLDIPSTHYQVLPSGNLTSSSSIIHVNIPKLEPPKVSRHPPIPPTPGDIQFPTDWTPLQVDPAYLEHLNEEFVTINQPRTYVSTRSLSFFTDFEHYYSFR